VTSVYAGPVPELRNVIVFTIGAVRYALELRWVREVVSLGFVTVVPTAPPALTLLDPARLVRRATELVVAAVAGEPTTEATTEPRPDLDPASGPAA